MRIDYSLLVLVCFMLTLTCAKPSPLQERLSPIKSTTGQNYALLKPLSASISYIYYATQSLSLLLPHDDQSIINTPSNNDSTVFFNKQNSMDQDKTKSIVITNNSSSNTIDVNHHNGPVTALALVLFFCVLTF